MKNSIKYYNKISVSSLRSKLKKKFDIRYSKIIKKIENNLNVKKDNFHFLSENFQLNFNYRDLDKYKKFKSVVVIGMGGSILGVQAIYSFLKHKIKKDFLFFDDIHLKKIQNFKQNKDLNKTLFIIISKSGETTETLSNLLFLNIIKKKSKNIIIISQRNDNPLYNLSKKNYLHHIEHKSFIGGRYSIFSEAGLVPAYLMGINISKLRKNLLIHFEPKNKRNLRDIIWKMTFLLKDKKINNIISLNYTSELKNLLFWKQQLIAESLGKDGKGFTPIISSAPKDHHSLLQLYLDGPKDKIFYIFSNNVSKKGKLSSKILGKKFKYLNKKNLDQIKDAQKKALIQTLIKKNIPYREFCLRKLEEQSLGELMSYFLLEIPLIGFMSNIDPFNQPAVERVKIHTKKLLLSKNSKNNF